MAGTVIEVDTSRLYSDISTINSEISALHKDAANLRETLGQLSSMWDGEAKTAFEKAVNGDIQKLEELINALQQFTDKTDTSRVGYENCESSVAEIIASIRV